MYRAVLTLLVGLILLASGSVHALNLNCERTTKYHDAFSNQQAFESWFPRYIRPTADDQVPASKDNQVRFKINGAIYDLTTSKWMLGKLPEKGGYKSVTGVRYKCNASSTQVKVAFQKNNKPSGDSQQTANNGQVGNILAGWPDKKICKWAMTRDGWEKNRAFQKYVTEAKLRGLTCGGVQRGELAPKNPLSTSNILAGWTNEKVCEFAVLHGAWEKNRAFQRHVIEAKRRGLNCGITEMTAGVSSDELKSEQKRLDAETGLATLKAQQKDNQKVFANDDEPPLVTIVKSGTNYRKGIIQGVVTDNVEIAEVLVDRMVVRVANDGSFEWTGFVPVTGKDITIEAIDTAALSSSKVIRLERGEIQQASGPIFDDLNPMAGKKALQNKDALALIVGISDYERTNAPAIYADKDAQYFHDYASLKLGIPDQNITTLVNDKAEQGDVFLAVADWMRRSSKPGKSDFYIFFAGHGLASQDGEQMYLLPYDGRPRLLDKTAILRNELFADIAAANPRSVTVFLDTCYSGATRGKDVLLASRPIAIRAKEQAVPEGFTVMTAAAGDQTAKPLEEAKHGMFSYFLMKGMEGDADANQDNQITAGELHAYVQQNVIQQSSGSQTPELQGDSDRVLVRFK